MIKEGKMTDAGLLLIKEAKKNGKWEKAYSSKKMFDLPDELVNALKKNHTAWENFNNFAPSYKNNYIHWVISAKREETKIKRINEVVKRAVLNQKPGML